MKNFLLLLCASVLVSSTNTLATDEIFLHNINDTELESIDTGSTFDLNKAYYSVDLHMPIIPSDLSMALGYELADGLVEVEVYVSARVSRFFSEEHDIQFPVGARVRVPLNGDRTILLEYQREFAVVGGSENGLYETPNMVSIMKRSKESNVYFGCGVGNMVHHAWADENHAPEDSAYFECKVGKKFK